MTRTKIIRKSAFVLVCMLGSLVPGISMVSGGSNLHHWFEIALWNNEVPRLGPFPDPMLALLTVLLIRGTGIGVLLALAIWLFRQFKNGHTAYGS